MYITIVTRVYYVLTQTQSHVKDSGMYEGTLFVIVVFGLCGMYIPSVLVVNIGYDCLYK